MGAEELDFLNSMEEAYKAGCGCDIDVHVGDRKFKASKWILCANSSVFRAMFSDETKENRTNSVAINEFDIDVVEQFLCYLHIGKFPDSCAEQTKFFPIADYYDVKQLREICLKATFLSLDPTTAQKYFKMAETFNLLDLKAKTLNVMTGDLKGETFYDYLEFARSNKSEELEAIVIKFIEDNVWELCTLPDWKKLDPELRLLSFENRVEHLDLDLKPALKRKLAIEVNCSGAATWNGVYYSKTIIFKNIGNMRLVYRISPTSADQHFLAFPQSGFIAPGQMRRVNIQYNDSQMVIIYQATTETDIDRCFQKNSFCRQTVLKLH